MVKRLFLLSLLVLGVMVWVGRPTDMERVEGLREMMASGEYAAAWDVASGCRHHLSDPDMQADWGLLLFELAIRNRLGIHLIDGLYEDVRDELTRDEVVRLAWMSFDLRRAGLATQMIQDCMALQPEDEALGLEFRRMIKIYEDVRMQEPPLVEGGG